MPSSEISGLPNSFIHRGKTFMIEDCRVLTPRKYIRLCSCECGSFMPPLLELLDEGDFHLAAQRCSLATTVVPYRRRPHRYGLRSAVLQSTEDAGGAGCRPGAARARTRPAQRLPLAPNRAPITVRLDPPIPHARY